jgi:hypothetical protein
MSTKSTERYSKEPEHGSDQQERTIHPLIIVILVSAQQQDPRITCYATAMLVGKTTRGVKSERENSSMANMQEFNR